MARKSKTPLTLKSNSKRHRYLTFLKSTFLIMANGRRFLVTSHHLKFTGLTFPKKITDVFFFIIKKKKKSYMTKKKVFNFLFFCKKLKRIYLKSLNLKKNIHKTFKIKKKKLNVFVINTCLFFNFFPLTKVKRHYKKEDLLRGSGKRRRAKMKRF